MFKVIITGGENFGDYSTFERKCINCLRNKAREGHGILICSTGDKYNDRFAKRFGINVREFSADFKKHGNNAILDRNRRMIAEADAAIVFDDGLSDTKFMIDQITSAKLPYRVIRKNR